MKKQSSVQTRAFLYGAPGAAIGLSSYHLLSGNTLDTYTKGDVAALVGSGLAGAGTGLAIGKFLPKINNARSASEFKALKSDLAGKAYLDDVETKRFIDRVAEAAKKHGARSTFKRDVADKGYRDAFNSRLRDLNFDKKSPLVERNFPLPGESFKTQGINLDKMRNMKKFQSSTLIRAEKDARRAAIKHLEDATYMPIIKDRRESQGVRDAAIRKMKEMIDSI